jgi:hypothetical protein
LVLSVASPHEPSTCSALAEREGFWGCLLPSVLGGLVARCNGHSRSGHLRAADLLQRHTRSLRALRVAGRRWLRRG